MAGRKSKYYTHVKPKLGLIKQMRIDGYKEIDIMKKLNVGHTAFNEYKRDHTELAEALRHSKEILIADLERSLFQLAKGGFTTKKTTRKYVEIDGVINGGIEITETIEEHKPNNTALIFSLKNLAPDKWAEKTQIESTGLDAFFKSMSEFESKL